MGTRNQAAIDLALLEQQDVALKAIRQCLVERGTRDTSIYIAGMVMGVADYLIATKGRREAYDFFQNFADDIIGPSLTRVP